jgi:hypothetical protein
MIGQKNNNKITNSYIRQSDSFVVDLRQFKSESISKPAAKEIAVKKTVVKRGPSFFQKLFFSFTLKKDNISKLNFLALPTKIKPLASNNIFKNIRLGIFWSQFFVFNQKKRANFYCLPFGCRYFKKNFHFSESRSFAKIAALRYRRLRYLRLNIVKKPEKKEKYLISWYRSALAFLFALIIIILPFKLLSYFKVLEIYSLKNNVISRAMSAFDNLAIASKEASRFDLNVAGSSFARAAVDFTSAQQELNRVDDYLLALASFSNDPKIKLASSGKQFLAAGAAGATFGQHLSDAAAVLLNKDENKSWGQLIDVFVEHGALALESAKELQKQLYSIDENNLPSEYRQPFLSFRSQSDLAVSALSSLLSSAREIKDFLGVSQDKRYLLVFQNNAEMRGAGGFFGSYALVDIRDGRVRKLEVPAGGSYDTEAGMRTFVQSPKPLWLVSPRWFFWDANWWPDWPTSARALMWFYEKSDGPTVDGVISFTPDVLADLLRISGPIDMQAEYGLTIDADNFWDLLQTTVEKDNLIKKYPLEMATVPDSPKNQPKKIIGDLMTRIMDKLPQVLSVENIPDLLSALEGNLSAKNIMLYFNDPGLQAKAGRYGLDGAMARSSFDYLLVAHTNIAGQKSDRRMVEKIEHDIQVLSDGSIIDTLTIKRAHTGIKNEILSGVRNVDWLRVYVPEGSQLLSASGFRAPEAVYFEEPEESWEVFPFLASTENKALVDLSSGTKVYIENGKTVFANWVMTDPGETSLVRFRYRLPFRLGQLKKEMGGDWWQGFSNFFESEEDGPMPFSLLIQKQPGASPADINFTLSLPLTWQQLWSYPQSGDWNGSAVLDRDMIRASLLEK